MSARSNIFLEFIIVMRDLQKKHFCCVTSQNIFSNDIFLVGKKSTCAHYIAVITSAHYIVVITSAQQNRSINKLLNGKAEQNFVNKVLVII